MLLFGAKKIPELMKGMGKGVRSFKEGMNEVKDEINKATPEEDLERLNREKEERRKAQDGQ